MHNDPQSTKVHVDLHVHMEGLEDICGRLAHVERLIRKLFTQGENIMQQIQEFSVKQKEAFARMQASFAGISSDFAVLLAKIEQLQNTSGAITAEDQALLDEVQAQAEAIAVSLEAVDAEHPPVVTPL